VADLPPDLLEAVESRAGDSALRELPAVLAALAEWCDGDLYDPTTGKRIEQETVGVDYCTEHTGIRNDDDHRCDFADGCETCNNSGVVTGFEGDAIECPRCDGEGVSSCALVPLFTLSPREDQP